MIQPIDQISTVQREKGGRGKKEENKILKKLERQQWLLGLSLLLLLAANTDLNFTPTLLCSFYAAKISAFIISCKQQLWELCNTSGTCCAPGNTDDEKEEKQLDNSVRFELAGFPSSSPGVTGWAGLLTCLVVMHPVQDDLWGSVPPCDHVASHLSISLSGQAKIQNLQCQRKNKEKGGQERKEKSYGQVRPCF